MIRANGVHRSFGGREVLRDVSFSVASGEVVGFLGPNGAGKTTTMRILLGLLRPTRGEARVDGPTGYVPENFTGYDGLTVRGYLRFMARMKSVDRADADRALAAAGLSGLDRRPIGRLSKGQRQRLGVAQGLLGRPAAYVLDEPTIGLDPRQVSETRRLVRSLADEGAAVLLSTHLLAEAAAVCDRVVVIAAGRVLTEERVDAGEVADLEGRFLRLVAEAELGESAAEQ